ncbi:MAG: hypothetical protein K2M82_04925 [Lachnospiraceae bacterium]|nr:hypothetical protein [Lachnospiraceae bacterium]
MKKRKKEAINMFFSAFLVMAYIVCSYFLLQLAYKMTNITFVQIAIIALMTIFGLFLFYATRVGDGKQVKRFSPSVLILMVLPSIYVISAFFAVGLPLHDQIFNTEQVLYLASVTLGYSIPYTFTSGFELVTEEEVYDVPSKKDSDKTDKNEKRSNKKNSKKKK